MWRLHARFGKRKADIPGNNLRNEPKGVTFRKKLDKIGFRGQLSGYLPQHWPTWFKPTLIDFAPRPFGPFTHSAPLTKAGDVQLVLTPGHTVGHYSVVVQEEDHALFFAGDASYTQKLMLGQVVDGVTLNMAQYQESTRQVLAYLQSVPTVYLPAHDPESAQRLVARAVAIPRERLIHAS